MIVRRQKHILFLSRRGYPNKKKRATASKTIKRRFRSDITLCIKKNMILQEKNNRLI
jgi:hypothetical protein